MSSSVPPPSSGPQRPPSPGRDLYEERGAGFSRAGFAPIPQRHQEIPAAEPSRDMPDPARGRRPSWGDRRDELDDGARVGGRGRDEFDRRPPPPRGWDEYDDRPKRRRSPSPFGSSHRPRRHSPSPSRPPISNLPDPAEVPNLLPFRQFADWFRASHPQTAKADEEELIKWREAVEAGQDAGSKDKVGMGKRYERYRKEFHSRQLYTLYLTHRETPWFQEKYSNRPEMIALRRRLNRQGRVPTAEKYLDALRAGDYNTLSFDMTSETDKRSSGGRRNSELEEPEGMDRALGDNHADDPLRVEVPPSDRQVFVKTVPPMTSRQELEAMFKRVDGFEYLAITEPAAKKSFHRVAWAQYGEGVNVEDVVKQLNGAKIDTFTFHMGVNATSVIGRIRVTAPVSNSLERLLKDGEKAKELAIKFEEDLMGDDEEDAKKAENEGEGKAKPEGDGDKPAEETKEASYPGLREQGSVVVQEKIDALLEDEGLSGDLNEERQTIRAKLVLDQWLSYLRHGLSTCYYCVASLPFPEELHRKCVSHLRPHPTTPTEQSLEAVPEGGEANESAETQEEKVKQHDEDDEDRRDADPDKAVAERKSSRDRDRRGGPTSKVQNERWEEGIDSKLRPLLETVDVAEYGGRDIEEETKKVSAPFIKQEEASKYRCKECTKLFKAPEFVLKHISVKHPEVIKAKLEDLPTLNNFVLDPQRLQPVPSTPAAVNDQIPAPALPMMPGGMASLPQMPTFNPAFAGGPGFGGGNGSNMNMMQQQMMMMMQMQQAMMMGMNGMGNGGGGGGRGGLGDRIGGYGPGGPAMSAPLPAPPPGGEDPRAKRGRVSYMDLDEPGGGGGGGLPY